MKEGSYFLERAVEVPEIEGKVWMISNDRAVARAYPGLSRGDTVSLPFVMPYNVDVHDAVRAGILRKGSVHLRASHGRHIHRTLDTGVVAARAGYTPDRAQHSVIKGAGNSHSGGGAPAHWLWEGNRNDDKEESVVGLCDISEASQDWHLTHRYNARGGRFGFPAVIYEIPKLPIYTRAGLELRTVEEVRKEKLLPQFADRKQGEKFRDLHTDFNTPVYYDKWYVSGVRLDDEFSMTSASMQAALKDCMQRLSEEDPTLADPKAYAQWWARMQARNLGVIHRDGLFHGSYHGGNLTLGGELTDLSGIFATEPEDLNVLGDSSGSVQAGEFQSLYEHVISMSDLLRRALGVDVDPVLLQTIAKQEYLQTVRRSPIRA